MLNNCRDKLSVLHSGPQHLGNSPLDKNAILLALFRYTDVNCTALGRNNFNIQALL